MIKKSLFLSLYFCFSSVSFAQNQSEQTSIITLSPEAKGYEIYKENCLNCHDIKTIAPRHFMQKNMVPELLISPWHENKGADLSLIYKQTEYSPALLLSYIQDFSQHPKIEAAHLLTPSDKEDLFSFIDWANQPYKITAIRLGIFSFIYLSILLIFWSLWAFKLQRRVVRRYDRYDVPSFPKNAPESLTKASNDP